MGWLQSAEGGDRPPAVLDMAERGSEGGYPATELPGPEESGEIPRLCARLREVSQLGPSTDSVRPKPNPDRDRLLGEYRRILVGRIHDDAAANLAELQALVRSRSDHAGIGLARTPVGADALARLRDGLTRITGIDPYVDTKSEERWWYALHQFYIDGLALADRLLTVRRPESPRRWQRPPRRIEVVGTSFPGLAHALVTGIEIPIPNVGRINPFDTYVPTLLHLLAHHVFPGKHFRCTDMFASSLGWIRRGGFNRMRGLHGATVRFEGLEHLHNDSLFDLDTWRTRHNVIIAASHRMGYLDWPLFFEPLRKIRMGVWAHNAFFGPGMERKIARDRYSIAIRGNHAPPLEVSLARTADLLTDARVPVFIMVDGAQPPMFYGQQMRVKKGVRLVVNETIRRSRGTDRHTYVLPLSLNDPVGFVQERQDVMRVAFHPPVLVDSVLELRRPEPETRSPGGGLPAAGDPLINHLEALFLLETTHAVKGLPQPRIVPTVCERLQHRHRSPLSRRILRTTIPDLARHAARRSN